MQQLSSLCPLMRRHLSLSLGCALARTLRGRALRSTPDVLMRTGAWVVPEEACPGAARCEVHQGMQLCW